jgi:hypothetical protein
LSAREASILRHRGTPNSPVQARAQTAGSRRKHRKIKYSLSYVDQLREPDEDPLNEKYKMKTQTKTETTDKSASELINARIAELGDWRGEALARMRALIKEADPEVLEEWKWMGTPVWSHDGGICTGESYKTHVKLTFHKGAFLSDPTKIFNASLDGNMRRAIDIHEGEVIDANGFKALIHAAIALNTAGKKKKPAKRK